MSLIASLFLPGPAFCSRLAWPTRVLLVLAAALGLSEIGAGAARSEEAPIAVAEIPGNPWERTIEMFERQDRAQAPVPGGVLFLGSSSIRLWDLRKSFPGVETVNRGFGGSQIADSVEFAERIVVPHRPRLIVFYAGDNDIASGKSAERILADFRALTSRVHAVLPQTRIAFVAIKPSPSRWKHFETQKKANALVAAFAASDPRIEYIDVVTPMLGEDGQPRRELFVKDNLHMSPEGYKVWNALIAPLISRSVGR